MVVSFDTVRKHEPLTKWFGQEQSITEDKKGIQRQTVLDMLKIGPVHCGKFLAVGIAQYNARIYELRRKGHNIVYENKNFILK